MPFARNRESLVFRVNMVKFQRPEATIISTYFTLAATQQLQIPRSSFAAPLHGI